MWEQDWIFFFPLFVKVFGIGVRDKRVKVSAHSALVCGDLFFRRGDIVTGWASTVGHCELDQVALAEDSEATTDSGDDVAAAGEALEDKLAGVDTEFGGIFMHKSDGSDHPVGHVVCCGPSSLITWHRHVDFATLAVWHLDGLLFSCAVISCS